MADEPIRIHIPVTWDYDRITDACAKLAELTGHDFKAEMLAAAGSGELPANGWYGIQDDPAGNLENARHHGARAAVCWDAVAEWLQTKGYDARRGRWIEFDKALEQLQARIAPAPTAAELESWCGLSLLPAFVDADSKWQFHSGNYLSDTQRGLPEQPSERRLRLWLDSEEVEAFAAIAPEHRELTIPQLSARWQVDEPKVWSRLKACSGVVCWPLMGSDPMPYDFVITLQSVKDNEADNPDWLKYDAFDPDRQLFPWLDLRERETHDAQRLSELMRTDPAGIHGRQRAAAALDLPRLSCWLEPDRIAALYGDPVLFDTLIQVIGVVLPVRRVCRGAAIHVDNWLRWPGRPQTPEGKAGELVRGWLSMATHEHDNQADDSKQPATVTEFTLKPQRLDEIDAELGEPLEFTGWNSLPPGFNPDRPFDRPDTSPAETTAAEPAIQPEPRTELQKPPPKKTRTVGIKRATRTACDVLLKRNPACRPSAQDVIEYWGKHADSEGFVKDVGMDSDTGMACAYWTDSRGNDHTASLRAIGEHIDNYLPDRGK
ncbi:hypothetical protein [Plasticicumulans sp.]|uniref:hypothetical protein n=1 Tax=Plasticicumulans sp. TaxID=2307179 RepID=UPI0032204136